MDEWKSSRLLATIDGIKEYYLHIESEFENNHIKTSFLWDHCYRVASIAIWLTKHSLALNEHKLISDEIIFLTGLLHDSGKFQILVEREKEIPEEKYSAQITQKLLKNYGWKKKIISSICEAIDELYQDNSKLPLSHLIRDADTLSKLGSQGLVSYISKWTLRGFPPREILTKKLSIELTYALNSEKSMLTPQGQKEAAKEGKWTLTFFKQLLVQWKNQGIIELDIQPITVEKFKIFHVYSTNHLCKHSKWSWNYILIPGVKCTKVQINGKCNKCTKTDSEEFCLPLLKKI